jgi:hypothetical protein
MERASAKKMASMSLTSACQIVAFRGGQTAFVVAVQDLLGRPIQASDDRNRKLNKAGAAKLPRPRVHAGVLALNPGSAQNPEFASHFMKRHKPAVAIPQAPCRPRLDATRAHGG